MGFANIPSSFPNLEFHANGTYVDAQAGDEIYPAMEGLSFRITNIVVSTEVAGWIRLISDTVGIIELIPKIFLGDNSSGGPTYTTTVEVPAGFNICVESSIVGNHSVMVNGYLAG